ncbi:FecR domain-containing protein [Larkinella bovis]|uniref:FecR domain-containing protein n=1 Tax=Larkinella bovis TaxID=683041 RepID=A0ABW0ICE4_9BACT
MKHPLAKQILFRYLSGQVNPIERQTVEEWLKNPAHIPTFHEWLLEWETQSLQYGPDAETAFEKLSHRINQIDAPAPAESDEPAPAPKPLFPFFGMLTAAVVLLVLGIGLSPLRTNLLYRTYQTLAGQHLTMTLDDGSRVSLNASSKLQVPRFGFYGPTREVLLTGEATFDITHKPDNQRFIVKTSDQFQVEVLGTEFTVYARQRGTNVVLNRGKIRVDYADGAQKRQLMMKPGELLTVNQQGKIELRPLNSTTTEAGSKEHLFVFNGTSLWEICYLLREYFGTKIGITNDSLARRTISGNFKAKNADELLETLSEVFNLKAEPNGDVILLTTN